MLKKCSPCRTSAVNMKHFARNVRCTSIKRIVDALLARSSKNSTSNMPKLTTDAAADSFTSEMASSEGTEV